jgi:peptidoglycan-associated lipoprotein
MRFKVLGLLAIVALVSACSDDTAKTGMDTGTGKGAPPMASSLTAAQELTSTVGDRVFFGLDKSDLSTEAHATLDRQVAWLRKYPSVTITVEGHCDERGTREYNLALGERRATAVKNYLVASGVDAGRVQTISYGKERPAVSGSTEAAWAQNRRAVTVVN